MIYEKEKRYIIPFEDVPAARAKMPDISVDERRGNFVECETVSDVNYFDRFASIILTVFSMLKK